MSRFPLTDFLVALAKMTPAQRDKASADKAAKRYGLSVEVCEAYIKQWRTVND